MKTSRDVTNNYPASYLRLSAGCKFNLSFSKLLVSNQKGDPYILPPPVTKMAMATSGSDLKVPSLAIPADERGEMDKDPVSTVKKRQKPGRKLNGIVKGDTRSMYISPSKCKMFSGRVWSDVEGSKIDS